MKEIRISDITVGEYSGDGKHTLTFKEKLETAKQLDKLGVSVIELGSMTGKVADNMLIKSVAAVINDSCVAVSAGLDAESIARTWEALKSAAHPRLQVCAGVSIARMEYVYSKKADAMLADAAKAVSECRARCDDVEFVAEDATRANYDYLCRIIHAAIEAGAGTVTICDTAGAMLPDEFGEFLLKLKSDVAALSGVKLGVKCSDVLGMADASTVAAIRAGADEIKVTALSADTASLEKLARIISAKSDVLHADSPVRITEIKRILQNIERLCTESKDEKSPFEDGVRKYSDDLSYTANDTMDEIMKGVAYLGYDLDDSDKLRVWKAFRSIAQRKEIVKIGELDAIVASEAMQVPASYTLENYVVTTGNAIDILAHVKLKKGADIFDGLSIGDGPIDAAFLAIEKITGHHYELDDFQIQAITEGREAMGQTVVKLRSGGKVYSGRGISTDIIGSGIAAYVNALNKIVYEEENA